MRTAWKRISRSYNIDEFVTPKKSIFLFGQFYFPAFCAQFHHEVKKRRLRIATVIGVRREEKDVLIVRQNVLTVLQILNSMDI